MNKGLLSGIYLVVSLLVMSSINLFAGDCIYNNTPSSWNCGSWSYNQTMTVKLDIAPSCDVIATYNIRTCTDPSCPSRTVTQIEVVGLGWDWDLCMGITVYIIPGYPNDFGTVHNERFHELFIDAQAKIALKQFENDFEATAANSTEREALVCSGTRPNCSMPNGPCASYEIQYSNPKCISWCYGVHTMGPGYKHFYFRMRTCSEPQPSTACCEHKRSYCKCAIPGTNPVEYETNIVESTTYISGTCAPESVPTGPACPTWLEDVRQTDCYHFCK